MENFYQELLKFNIILSYWNPSSPMKPERALVSFTVILQMKRSRVNTSQWKAISIDFNKNEIKLIAFMDLMKVRLLNRSSQAAILDFAGTSTGLVAQKIHLHNSLSNTADAVGCIKCDI